MQAFSSKRRRESPFEEASSPTTGATAAPTYAGEILENLEASSSYRLERALTTVDKQAAEVERLQGELQRLRRLEEQHAGSRAAAAPAHEAAAAAAASAVATAEATARRLQGQVEAAQAESRSEGTRADEATRRYQQLLREYQVAEEDRLRLASQLKEAVEDLEGSSSRDPEAASLQQFQRENATLKESAARAEGALAEAERSHSNDLATASSLAERRLVEIEQLQKDLSESNTKLTAARKETRQTDELEAQLLRVKCELREQQRLSENAEVVRSLQSALHDTSAEVAAARKLKERTENAEALNEEITALRTKLVRAEKAAEAATRSQVEHEARASELERWRALSGLLSEAASEVGAGTPEAVKARIHALHAENVRLTSDKSSLSQRQGSAAASEKQLQARFIIHNSSFSIQNSSFLIQDS